MEVPADTFATLTEQTTLLLGQASLSISYTHCLNILKTLWKDPCKAKALLKEKQPHCQKMKVTYLAKNPFINNWNWMLKEKYSLLKSPLPSQNRPKCGGWYYYTAESSNQVQNKNVQFQNNASASTSKFHCAGSASNGKYFFYNSKGGTCHQQFRTGSTNKDCNSSACASNNKNIIYKKHSKCTISRRTSLVHSCLGKNYSGSWNIIYCKWVQNPGVPFPISRENITVNKNVKRIIFISGTGSFGNVRERSYPKSSTNKTAISDQSLPCRKLGWRKPPCDYFKKIWRNSFPTIISKWRVCTVWNSF